MSAGSDGANTDWDAFFAWCQNHEDVPAVGGLLACMTVLSEIDRRNAPKHVKRSIDKVYDYLMTEVERIRGQH